MPAFQEGRYGIKKSHSRVEIVVDFGAIVARKYFLFLSGTEDNLRLCRSVCGGSTASFNHSWQCGAALPDVFENALEERMAGRTD